MKSPGEIIAEVVAASNQSGAPSGAAPVYVEKAALAQLKSDAEHGRKAALKSPEAVSRQAGKVDAAIAAGKIAPARRGHYVALMAKDEQGTAAFLEKLTPVFVTGGQASGDGGSVPVKTALAALGFRHLASSEPATAESAPATARDRIIDAFLPTRAKAGRS